jgi:hypothetical protein
MTYAVGGLIQASDYNNLIGSSPSGTANKLNTVWAVGQGNAGYGQTALGSVSTGATVQAAEWAGLNNRIGNAASHQGSSITSITGLVVGGLVKYTDAGPAFINNLSTIYTNRLNASSVGSTSTNVVTRPSGWSDNIIFDQTVTFSSGDAARYFFNAGGQIGLSFSNPTGSAIDNIFNALATACGTIWLSAPNSGSISIASVSYNGVTKSGGSGSVTTLSTNLGYYGLTSSYQTIFKQLAGYGGYLGSFIEIQARTNGTQGSNGDNGSIVYLRTIWDEVPNGLTVSAGTTTTLTLRPPSTTHISNTWGTPSLSGSQSGS